MNAGHTHHEFLELREKSGLSIREVAALTGKSDRMIRRYEKSGDSGTVAPHLVLEALRYEVQKRKASLSQNQTFRFIDLFAGIGGLRVPFDELGGKCVFTAEWDRFARETYAANFPETDDHMFAGDIRPFAENPERIPDHDVLLAGFPCQPFSIAGVSKKNSLGRPHGFLCDTQGTLFYDLAEIIRFHRPPAFLLENVKNLERHDGGRTFATIMHVLRNELGYEVHTRVISSQHWVPQKRERIFIVGFREPSDFSFDNLELPSGDGPLLGSILETDPDEKYTLSPKLWNYLQGYRKKHESAGNGFGYSLFGPNDVTRTLSARYYKDGSEILIEQKGKQPRRLTPRECARLMGFEKPGQTRFNIPVSDTQAYRQFGNAVVVPVVRAVADLMKPHLFDALASRPEVPPQRELPFRHTASG
ncbi:DNA (cytosine-5-)-methyltransferase [Hyphomonas sp. NPDC076900]|uniref:DNA (cytosine-5-)-methyltransferase n=1 Tax=Hyphomonas sp. NPDC076900 TaxID=3390570 RepID=UPI003CFC366E